MANRTEKPLSETIVARRATSSFDGSPIPGDDLKKIIEQTGSYNWLLMGSDYPHSEGVEQPSIFAEEACRELTPEQTRAIMYENGMRFMELPLTTSGAAA